MQKNSQKITMNTSAKAIEIIKEGKLTKIRGDLGKTKQFNECKFPMTVEKR